MSVVKMLKWLIDTGIIKEIYMKVSINFSLLTWYKPNFWCQSKFAIW